MPEKAFQTLSNCTSVAFTLVINLFLPWFLWFGERQSVVYGFFPGKSAATVELFEKAEGQGPGVFRPLGTTAQHTLDRTRKVTILAKHKVTETEKSAMGKARSHFVPNAFSLRVF